MIIRYSSIPSVNQIQPSDQAQLPAEFPNDKSGTFSDDSRRSIGFAFSYPLANVRAPNMYLERDLKLSTLANFCVNYSKSGIYLNFGIHYGVVDAVVVVRSGCRERVRPSLPSVQVS